MHDTFYEIIIRTLNIYKMAIVNENNYEVIMKKVIESFQTPEIEGPPGDEDFKNYKFPTFLRFIFPILSPIYYLLGGPILAATTNIRSNKLTDILIKGMVNGTFYEYFDMLIVSFNKGIESLKEINENFENFYKENNN